MIKFDIMDDENKESSCVQMVLRKSNIRKYPVIGNIDKPSNKENDEKSRSPTPVSNQDGSDPSGF